MEKPKVIIMDFDGTMASLYKNKNLLLDLSKIIFGYYSNFILIDEKIHDIDVYVAWYCLHKQICSCYDYEKACSINKNAEKLVTKFEMEIIKQTNFFDDVLYTINSLKNKNIELMIVSSNSTKMLNYSLKRECLQSLIIVCILKI